MILQSYLLKTDNQIPTPGVLMDDTYFVLIEPQNISDITDSSQSILNSETVDSGYSEMIQSRSKKSMSNGSTCRLKILIIIY